VLDDRRSELRHPLSEPSGNTAPVEREIGGARAFHNSIIDSEDDEWNRGPYILSCNAKFPGAPPKILTRSYSENACLRN
jgi:hypothetical protein